MAPEQWEDSWDTTPPNAVALAAAAQKKWTYDANGAVTQETGICSSCGGGGGSTDGVSYYSTIVNPTPADLDTVYKRVKQVYPGDSEQSPTIQTEVNQQGQVLTEKRKVDQSKVQPGAT